MTTVQARKPPVKEPPGELDELACMDAAFG